MDIEVDTSIYLDPDLLMLGVGKDSICLWH